MKKYSDEWFVDQYFQFGSVEEAVRSSEENLPISVAQFHRIVAKSGLVKSPGRQVSLPEILHFFREKALTPGTPIEKLYKKMPYDFLVSLTTIHRVYKSIQNRAFRREGAALILLDSNNNILIGQETQNNFKYGKAKGQFSIPMGFAKKGELDYESALRIAQHEVSPSFRISKSVKPSFYFDLVDVRIKVFKIKLSSDFNVKNCKSYRLTNHQFTNKSDLIERSDLREGVKEIIQENTVSNLNKVIEMGSSQRLALHYLQ